MLLLLVVVAVIGVWYCCVVYVVGKDGVPLLRVFGRWVTLSLFL